MTKALVLFSGGLDSMIAVKLLQEQNIKVEGITFTSVFFDAEKAKESAKQLGIKLDIVDLGSKYVDLVRHPKHGYGSAINPCIDCHAFMLKKAKQLMKKEKADFIATGEVLNERPMSQTKKSLMLIFLLRLTQLQGNLRYIFHT